MQTGLGTGQATRARIALGLIISTSIIALLLGPLKMLCGRGPLMTSIAKKHAH
jgi:hypothetical protein